MNILFFDPFQTGADYAALKKLVADTGAYPNALNLLDGSHAFGIEGWEYLKETLFSDSFDAVLLFTPDDVKERGYCLKDLQRYSKLRDMKTVIAVSNDTDRKRDFDLLAAGAGYVHHANDDPRILIEYMVRSAGAPARPIQKYKVGPLEIDWQCKLVTIDDAPVNLSGGQYKTLFVLGHSKGPVSVETLRDRVSDNFYGDTTSNTPKIHVRHLRLKFATVADPDSGYRLIRTQGLGYSLVTSEEAYAAPYRKPRNTIVCRPATHA